MPPQLERSHARSRKHGQAELLGVTSASFTAGEPPPTPRTSMSSLAAPNNYASWPPGGEDADGGAEMVAALHEALLGAGICGSLREQARALERRGSTGGRHRRLPSDPSAPEFAAATSPGATSPPPGEEGRGVLPPRVSAPPTLGQGRSLALAGSRGRSSSMLALQPMAEDDGGEGEGADLQARRAASPPANRRWSVDVSAPSGRTFGAAAFGGGAAAASAAAATAAAVRHRPPRGGGSAALEARLRGVAAAAHAAAASPLVFNRPPPSPEQSSLAPRRTEASGASAGSEAASLGAGADADSHAHPRNGGHGDADIDGSFALDADEAGSPRSSAGSTPGVDATPGVRRRRSLSDRDDGASGSSTPDARSRSPADASRAGDARWRGEDGEYESSDSSDASDIDDDDDDDDDREVRESGYDSDNGPGQEAYASDDGDYYDDDDLDAAVSHEGGMAGDGGTDAGGRAYGGRAFADADEGGAASLYEERGGWAEASEAPGHLPPSPEPGSRARRGARVLRLASPPHARSPSPDGSPPRAAVPTLPLSRSSSGGTAALAAALAAATSAAAAAAVQSVQIGFGSFDPNGGPEPERRGSADGGAAAAAAAAAARPVAVPSAVANRIQWELTVSDLNQLLPEGAAGAADGGDEGTLRGLGSGGDPLTEACARANVRVVNAVTAARHAFSLAGMLSAPDAAPLRVALREAREYADALANFQPAARGILVGILTTAVTDVATAALAGVQEMGRHLAQQSTAAGGPAPRRDRRLSATSAASADSAEGGGGTPRAGSSGGAAAALAAASSAPSNAPGSPAPSAAPPPSGEAPDVSGVVAGGKPLGEALHALLRWGKNIAEFADPTDIPLTDAVSSSFTAAFLQLALLWGGLVAAAHAARRPGVDGWRWAHSLEGLGKDQLLFVRSLSQQGFAQGCLAGPDYEALKATVDSTVRIVKALDAELSAPHPVPAALGAPGVGDGADPVPGDGPPDAVGFGWEVDMTDMRLGQKVGAGSYGQVFRATWRAAPVAVKLFDKQWADSEELMAAVRREAALMARHRHPHVLLFMGVCTRPPNLAIVTEFCDNGSLHDVLRAKRETPEALAWVRRLMFAADAARGLNYLHTSRPATVHADLNTSNLLVDRGWRVKVADFGLSRLLQNAPRGVIQGTNVSNKNASHLAPEVLRSEPYGTPSDVFSFGCVLWALATLAVPWEQLQEIGNNLAIAHRIAYEQERLELPREVTPAMPELADYNALITDCFQEDPAARPKMEAVLERLLSLQQRIIRRENQDKQGAAATANGGASGAACAVAQTVLISPSRTLSAATRRASNAAAVAAASAAHWRDAVFTPSRSWMLVAGLPVLTGVLSWAIARRIYSQAGS